MDCAKGNTEPFGTIDGSFERRSANYKPNIWNYDLIQSLTNEYTEDRHTGEAQELRKEIINIFVKTVDPVAKLELIDRIEKVGLAYIFEEEIKEAMDASLCSNYKNHPSITTDLYATSLCFRLLRQHGYVVSQDMFERFVDGTGKFTKGALSNTKAMLELYEASHLALEDEHILNEASLSTAILKTSYALKLPLQWGVEWYNVKRQIQILGKEDNTNNVLLKLAKLNFNRVQAAHHKDLREILRWWRNLGLAESLSFTRNRIVESYLWAVGVAFEPREGSLRKWLAKVTKMIIIIDDIYDVYGSLEELEHFTAAVNRWDTKEIEKLPDCMKICFQTLHEVTNEIAFEIQKEKGWNLVLPYLQQAWADFCKALLVEAQWYNKGYTPSLQEYLDNGWISSSGPVLSLHVLFSVTHEVQLQEQVTYLLQKTQDLVHYTSLIIRLCNDEGTSAAELERGDAPSSILCFMREANASEEAARKHIRSVISNTWKKINKECIIQSPLLKPFVKYTTNTARVAHFIYQNGDGFGVQDRETRDQISSLLVEPLVLD
ncbi:hypothetical protein LguiA_025308 [Lonicera macranthoides]